MLTSDPKRLLVQNIAWANEITASDTHFFENLAKGQNPDVLWIGCSDSRVPAETITHAQPGELFVHRNIANIAGVEDCNAMSVIEFAVQVLKVKHIVVCGHHCCGGIRAALTPPSPDLPFVNQRIAVLRRLAMYHQDELNDLKTIDERVDRLAELNVMHQVKTLANLSMIQLSDNPPSIHGWIFSIHDGHLKVLTSDNENLNSSQHSDLIAIKDEYHEESA